MDRNTMEIVQAIQAANQRDETKIIDDIIADVGLRNVVPTRIEYIDLSIDRSGSPQKITGAGTFIIAAEATDDQANVSIGFGSTESDANKRITLRDGKRLYLPFTEFYVYHAAQAGKYMKLMVGRENPSMKVGVEDDSGESANADLSVALGNSSVIATAQVAVATTAGGTTIKAANTARRRITIKVPNDAGVPVFIRNTAPTVSNGYRLDPGDSITLNTTSAIVGIVSVGTVTVSYLEE